MFTEKAIKTGCFCYLNKTLVYVNCIVGTMATVTMDDAPDEDYWVTIESLVIS